MIAVHELRMKRIESDHIVFSAKVCSAKRRGLVTMTDMRIEAVSGLLSPPTTCHPAFQQCFRTRLCSAFSSADSWQLHKRSTATTIRITTPIRTPIHPTIRTHMQEALTDTVNILATIQTITTVTTTITTVILHSDSSEGWVVSVLTSTETPTSVHRRMEYSSHVTVGDVLDEENEWISFVAFCIYVLLITQLIFHKDFLAMRDDMEL
ncbi:hypothetical protein RB195_002472 [Necator americanus]